MAKRYEALIDNPSGDRDVILIVCPPSHDQQGAKFLATMESIRARFNLQAIWLADALDHHNSGSLLKATQRGDEWLQRHGDLIRGVPLHRWAEVRQAPHFQAKYAEIQRLYAEVPAARQAVNEICRKQAFVIAERVKVKGEVPDLVDIQRRCVSYMLEEVAGLAVIRNLTAAPEVYPGEFFSDPSVFNRHTRVGLDLPKVLPVRFIKVTGSKLAI